MIKEISISLPAKEALSEQSVKQFVTQELGLGPDSLFTVQVVKRSIDARNRNIKMNLKLPYYPKQPNTK